MIDRTLVMVTGLIAQTACAVLVALMLQAFYRLYRRRYLAHWARSWWAFSVYLLGGALGFFLYNRIPATSPTRTTVSMLSLIGGYLQMGWLLFGTYEVTTGRAVSRKLIVRSLAALALLAVGSVLLSAPFGPTVRLLLRVGGRTFFCGLAFLVAGGSLLWTAPPQAGFGRRLLAGAYLLYGLQQIHYSVIVGAQGLVGRSLTYPTLLVVFDVLLQAAMGMGMVIWLLEDERKRVVATSEQMEHLAYHDTLTGLPNRSLFLDHLRVSLARAERDRKTLAVVFVDLDAFKTINDTLGHACGDEVLRIVSERLRGVLRQGDVVARLAGDEFTLLLPGAGEEQHLPALSSKLLAAFRQPIHLQGRELVVTASLGVSRYPLHGSDPEELLRKADLAMYAVKRRGGDALQRYVAELDAHAADRAALEGELRQAVENGEMRLVYQPIFDARTRRIQGVEALLRWQHPARGLLAPAEFLSIAELSGLSHELDLWVLRTACRERASWGLESLRLAVNLSARPYRHPELSAQVAAILAETGLAAGWLEVEITESLAMQDAEESLGVLRSLKDLGVRIAIDDFGTGYSSLAYLDDFPIDTLKIDPSFTRALDREPGTAGVPAAMIVLAHGLGLRVVAEGVESEEQLAALTAQGCDEVQGYLLSPPLSPAECRQLALESASAAPVLEAG